MDTSLPPLYLVPFRANEEGADYSPILLDPNYSDASLTAPHGISRDAATALPGLWYALHLPRIFADCVDIRLETMKAVQGIDFGHRILFLPMPAFNLGFLERWLRTGIPMLTICHDELFEESSKRSDETGFLLPPIKYSDISGESLRGHWDEIHKKYDSGIPPFGGPPTLAKRLDLAPLTVPTSLLIRQMGHETEINSQASEMSLNRLHEVTLEAQVLLSTIARLERLETPQHIASKILATELLKESSRMRFPVTLSWPGVADAYSRRAYSVDTYKGIEKLLKIDARDDWSPNIASREDSLVERSGIEFAVTHRALANGGAGLTFPNIPREAFVQLAQLEQHFSGPRQSGFKVKRMLEKLDNIFADQWDEGSVNILHRASFITAFSNFPVGLLTLPGQSSPLCTTTPITYSPLLPLMRTLQIETMNVPAYNLSGDIQVLVLECIDSADPVGELSRQGWQHAEEILSSTPGVTFQVVEASTANDARRAIAETGAEFLIISAHGFYNRAKNIAGIRIGTDYVIGPELGELPPVVILSACSVAPKGISAVTITDLLIRQGAVTVLGTQVPVNVFHNATLMARMFVYIAEVRAGRRKESNFLELWHHVQSSNAVVDILHGCRQLSEWMKSPTPSGNSVLHEFMNLRSVGRIRLGHTYSDTESVLIEMARDMGVGPTVSNLIKKPYYVPESLFYVLAGRPDQIFIRSPGDVVNARLGLDE